MSKIDDFKLFIKTKPEVVNKIHNGELSWQMVYEIYDIKGENDPLFQNEKSIKKTEENKSTTSSINSALKAFQDIDMDKVTNNLQSIQKVLSIFSEFGKSNNSNETRTHSMSRGRYRRYND